MSRLNRWPGRDVWHGWTFLTLNMGASLVALFGVQNLDWTFGQGKAGTVQTDALQVLVAGLGAMAIIRTAVSAYRGTNKVAVLPIDKVVDIALNHSADEISKHENDRLLGKQLGAGVIDATKGLSPEDMANSVARICLNNVEETQAKVAMAKIIAIRDGPGDPGAKVSLIVGVLVPKYVEAETLIKVCESVKQNTPP